jgi:hypothetical protein
MYDFRFYQACMGQTQLVFILQLGFKEVLPLGSAQCFKKIVDVPMNMVLSKKRKRKSYELK